MERSEIRVYRASGLVPDCASLHPGNDFEIAGLFRLLAVLSPIYPLWMGAVKSISVLL
jgi:hypothetical protein